MAAYAGLALAAYSQIQQGNAAKTAGSYNQNVHNLEGQSAEEQALGAETINRRQSREFLGRQQAAIGQAGIGYGGSSAGVAHESAVNAELDALNTRYRGQFTKWGLVTQGKNLSYEGRVAQQSGYLGAGASVLKGVADYGLG